MKKYIILMSYILFAMSFDYYLFVEIWPGSWLHEDNVKYNFTNNYFTIHGIWPQYWNGSWPQYCNKTEKFNVSKLQGIYDNLTLYWTDFKDPVNFWKHEYLKHMTCVEGTVKNPYKIFYDGLYLRNDVDLYSILESNNIYPSNTDYYDIQKIKNAIDDKLNTSVVITCDKYNILDEIRLCLDKNQKIINCPDNEFTEGCKSQMIWFNKV